MKNRSIRFKITLWYAVAILLIAGLTLLAIRIAAGVVLRHTVREYLTGVVEENTDEIVFVEKKTAENDAETGHLYVAYQKGFLRIDDNFMNTVSDVHSAIYTEKGEMLYGENPLARETEGIPFSGTRLWKMKDQGMTYNIYDRALHLDIPSGEEVWVRGIVSEEENVARLRQITRLALLIIPFLILIAVLLGYLLSGRMLRPLREMELTASRITAGSDLNERLETSGNRDELSRLAESFNEMISRLEHSFETERQFTSDASHELRTPLSVILAQTEYTLEKERDGEDYKEALEVVQKQGKRMQTLINDMLDYTRMDQSAERYPLAPLDLSAIVRESTEQNGIRPPKGIRLLTEIEEGIQIQGNRILLMRLLQNLIGNAFQYGKNGGMTKVELVRCSGDDKGRTIRLSVEDDGIGIAKEEQDRIFERFYRSDASRSVQGTGLGLSMVKKIAELHDAGLVLESEPGYGSTFSIFFTEV